MSFAEDGPQVAIVGAGIGGVALASALMARGTDVRIYEQASAFARVGAGIQMTPNAVKVLRGLSLEEKLRAIAFEPISGLNREHASGTLTNELPLAGTSEQRYGAPLLLLHRGDLHAALAETLPPGTVRFGKKLMDIRQQHGKVLLEFSDGSQEEADVLIGADGVHSRVRELMLGAERPRYTGKVAYRTTFPSKLIAGVTLEPYRTKWWGPDRHIVIYYVRRQRDEIYFVTSQPEPAEWMTTESWSAKGDVGELRQAFADFHPEVRAVLAACPDVHRWALLERDPLRTWIDGHVALLGDACHPMTPYMAQGAASALEDAAILTRCLAGATAATLNERLKRYEAARKPRASKIQSVSGTNTWMRQPTDANWVYGYDAWTAPLV
jgi:2-polyprenyl-6-methoxyphenol hydroxylase-like FAD-dependent oxidoreductase